ncbi:class I adenylate-forming enzyme family protein [Amycolatopsis sp. NPDC059090]|uniref:class I adenylate-forming enzyme family protein n=1 Tax=unclassified Amycolatopsis TaxID=2618356 RepID=UPI00366E974F
MATAETASPPDSIAAGPPLDTIAEHIGGPRIDDLLRRAAECAPERAAFRYPGGEISYAALNAKTTRCGAALRELAGSDTVIALSMVLSVDFAVGFFGISRSGNASALLNPYLPAERLVQLLRTCGARIAIVSPQVYRNLAPAAGGLPDLQSIVLTHREGGIDAPTLDELAARAGVDPAAGEADPESLACLQFTSGTTGTPKAVRLSHRNLAVNAAQTVHGQQLTESSVLFNFLPTFHSMHLTAGVAAAATHVLCPGDDIAGSVDAARRHGATHYYSLPVRLARLAADPRLPELEAPASRGILSGGSALSPHAASLLSEHFSVPVVQGYGLAETSPSMLLGNLDEPRSGSCGVLVPGGECRIVDVETRAVRPVGSLGEIQVRGPQLMLGYLGRDLAEDVDEDGWFSTGDAGHLDADGYLFVIDRLKDVFKHDNWLVAPSEIEKVVRRHPEVRDCVVFDCPDELHGAVAYAQIVADGDALDPAAVRDFVNAQVPYYEQLGHVELVDRIPRSPVGKVSRRDLRERALGRESAH